MVAVPVLFCSPYVSSWILNLCIQLPGFRGTFWLNFAAQNGNPGALGAEMVNREKLRLIACPENICRRFPEELTPTIYGKTLPSVPNTFNWFVWRVKQTL